MIITMITKNNSYFWWAVFNIFINKYLDDKRIKN